MPIPAAQRFVTKAASDIERCFHLVAREKHIQIVLCAQARGGNETPRVGKSPEINELQASGLKRGAHLAMYELYPSPSFRIVDKVPVETVSKPRRQVIPATERDGNGQLSAIAKAG